MYYGLIGQPLTSRPSTMTISAVLVVLLAISSGGNLSSSVQPRQSFYESLLPSLSYGGEDCLRNGSGVCSQWSYCDKHGHCQCYRNRNEKFQCDRHGNRLSIRSCYCLTYSQALNTTLVGLCMYNCYRIRKFRPDVNPLYIRLPGSVSSLNSVMCGHYNRTGTLCGRCVRDTYLPVYSYGITCVACSGGMSNWIKYMAVAYVPLTMFYLVILLLKVNVLSSNLQGYILFCQVVTSPIVLRAVTAYIGSDNFLLHVLLEFFGTLCGIWNLDFLRLTNLNICFRVTPLTVMSLDLLLALYPLLLMCITYIIIALHDSNCGLILTILRPLKAFSRNFKKNWDIRTSTIDAFTTFMLLSNVKFLNISLDLLFPVQVCDTSSNGSCKWAVFNDASIPYFGRKHLPYAVTAALVIVALVIVPSILLTLYPFAACQKCLTVLPRRWRIVLHVFIDSFQGCYKNGTDPNTKDYRWVSGIPFLLRLAIVFMYMTIVVSTFSVMVTVILVLTAIIILVTDPFKEQFKESSNHLLIFVLLLASVFICSSGFDLKVAARSYFVVILILIAVFKLFYVVFMVLRWLLTCKNCNSIVKICC